MTQLERIPIGSAATAVLMASGAAIGEGRPHPDALASSVGGALIALADFTGMLGEARSARSLLDIGMEYMSTDRSEGASAVLMKGGDSATLLATLLDLQWAAACAIVATGADHEGATADHMAQRLSTLGIEGGFCQAQQWDVTPDYIRHLPHHHHHNNHHHNTSKECAAARRTKG